MTTENADIARPAVTCRCCGSRQATLVGKRYGNFLKRDFDFWHCAACDYVFVDPFPGYGVYSEDYYSGTGPDPYVDYESESRDYGSTDRIAEFDDFWRLATGFMEASLPAGDVRWLDFGCGAGGFMKFLRDRARHRSAGRSWTIQVCGHDVGTYADRLSREEGFSILGFDELAAQPDGRYEVISLIEVVEHLEYPDLVFALAARLLKPGGLLLVTTGNIASFVARQKGLDYAYMIPEIHVGYFTPGALEAIYRRHGLVPVRFRYGGAVRFKVIKTLRSAASKRFARIALRLPFAVRLIDALYGTSKMPCATKPRPRGVG